MNKEVLEAFVNRIEDLSKSEDANNYVEDAAGKYLKRNFLETAVSDAKKLIRYGEYKIALENLLENLNEVSIMLDEDTAELARMSFGERLAEEAEELFSGITEH